MAPRRSKRASTADAVSHRPDEVDHDSKRIAAVHQLAVLDTAPEERFDRLTRLACKALQMPAALLSLVDESREWLKSVHGFSGPIEFSRTHSFGDCVVRHDGRSLIVDDAATDPRFDGHPLTAGPEGFRFFAGYALTSIDGFKVGVLGVLDRQSRDFSEDMAKTLHDLAMLAEQELRGIPLPDTLDRLAMAERRAEEQHARFAAFMENLPNVAFLKDGEGRTLFGNRYYEELFGVRLSSVLGKKDDEWLPPDVAAATMKADREVLATGHPLRIEEDIPTVLGSRHWLTFKFPVPTPSGERLLGGIAVDITTQKETERQLQELLALQHALLNSANVAIISTGPNGYVHTFNTAAERLFGYRADEVVDKVRPETWHHPEELQRVADEIFRETGEVVEPTTEALRWELRHRPVAEHELMLLRKDGSTFRGTLALTALWSGGQIIGHMGVIQDVTARREIEEAQRRAREEAEDANRAKSQFVANMSHEVRTPLNGILGITGMLLETELQPQQRELAEFILASGQALLTIVNDVLDFSKVEAGHMELEAIRFDLRELIGSVCDLHRARAEEKGLVLQMDVSPDVPSGLYGDPARLRQVLHNLVSNALKFSEDGPVRVVVTLDGAEVDAVHLRFDVIDRGIGIPADKQAHIFDPFTQADVSTTRLFGGSGLGLSICRQFVELMGGTIGVQSEPGRGSDFWFTAPFELSSAAPPETKPAPPRKLDPLPRLRVLVAEDSAMNRLVTTHQLQKLGCEVHAVENGRQAVDLTSTIRFDLILMDCQMPVLDGYEATTAIRETEERDGGHVPIIAVTASALSGERDRCLATGMDGYLSKPFKPGELHDEIRSVLSMLGDTTEVTRPSLDPKVIDELRRECGDGGDGQFQRYIDFFHEDIAQAESDLAAAEAQERGAALASVAHRLRGAAVNFGAFALMDRCARLEKAVFHGAPFEDVTRLLVSLRSEIDRAKEALAAAFPRS